MADAAWEVQKAVYAVLDAALAVPVYDAVPAAEPYPFVTIGEASAVAVDTKVEDGQEHTLTIHVWDRPAMAGGADGASTRGAPGARKPSETVKADRPTRRPS